MMKLKVEKKMLANAVSNVLKAVPGDPAQERELEDLEKRIGVMFISSEIDELLNVCDKIYVSADGDVIQGFDRKDFNKQDILSVAVRGKKLDE